jgi:phosphate transport system permease protein
VKLPSLAPAPGVTPPRDSVRSWPLLDRLGYFAAWGAGVTLIAIAGAIVIYMAWRGAQYFDLGLLTESPNATLNQAQSGGFKDPLIGTALLLVLSTAIAAPLGVAIAVWLTEYGRPSGLARAVESAVEVVAGTPSIVLAMFGLVFFQQQWISFLTFHSEGSNVVLGRSFIAAAAMMSLLAVPLVVGATREALNAIPGHVREASYALGKTKAATIRRVLLPAARPGIGTGTALGMGRVAGDTAIVVVLLGAVMQINNGSSGVFGLFRGIGSTLTSYVYYNSPAGEGLAPEKAYFAAFVLLLFVIFLNFVVTRLARGRSEPWSR